AGTTNSACSILVRKPAPTSAPASTSQRAEALSVARTVAYAAATSTEAVQVEGGRGDEQRQQGRAFPAAQPGPRGCRGSRGRALQGRRHASSVPRSVSTVTVSADLGRSLGRTWASAVS